MGSDSELLELAAKAAGLILRGPMCVSGEFQIQEFPRISNDWVSWNPLTDDGDALRLASQLELDIQIFHGYGEVWCGTQEGGFRAIVDMTNDRAADYRRAIVRAAAEIGGAMK